MAPSHAPSSSAAGVHTAKTGTALSSHPSSPSPTAAPPPLLSAAAEAQRAAFRTRTSQGRVHFTIDPSAIAPSLAPRPRARVQAHADSTRASTSARAVAEAHPHGQAQPIAALSLSLTHRHAAGAASNVAPPCARALHTQSTRGRSRLCKALPHLSPGPAPGVGAPSTSPLRARQLLEERAEPASAHAWAWASAPTPIPPFHAASAAAAAAETVTGTRHEDGVIAIVTGRTLCRATHPSLQVDAWSRAVAAAVEGVDGPIAATRDAASEEKGAEEEEEDEDEPAPLPLPIMSRLPEGALRESKAGDDDADDLYVDDDASSAAASSAVLPAPPSAHANDEATASTRFSFGSIAPRPKGYLRAELSQAQAQQRYNVLYTRARLPVIDAASIELWRALHAFKPITKEYNRGYLQLRRGVAQQQQQQQQQATCAIETDVWPTQVQAPHPVTPDARSDECPALFAAARSFGSTSTLHHLRRSFNWSALPALSPSSAREWYGVAFRSARRPGSASDTLYAADRWAHEEAVASGGLLFYWYATPDARTGENLATCIWTSRADAVRASRLRMHAIAAREAQQAFSDYDLYRYRVVKRAGQSSISIEPWE
ncbi:hypothetical protein K437DRAFT_111865 [Tilletiaria anomala UBC 951]|uniref:Uncharacterized protein n=1 Tax=Tilletiaria anomala (strain ATCC 24038 / CBS 436.72 / UBC 951) TaxID=1037660 RepID=A0A066W083_TILAU|nr:uncharacterized protein K437DRAFT_111865 [Tilletiaria anomala UBC 951]KDN45943.1 hypothetical protein K437DRAFT_111865 [Tilletiaria anomala UBC 951]